MTPLAALPLAFAAGVLTILSPCVLPLAPIVVAGGRRTALQDRWRWSRDWR